jgi:hypothetical protein
MSRFLTGRWERLVMLNYEVDPSVLLDRVPRGTSLDAWNGKHFVSVVGFEFLDTRVLGIPVPWHRNFEEVNLRFYVRREVNGEVRRGVVFIKEIVPHAAIAWLANAIYNERYVAFPMSHTIDALPNARCITYRFQDADRSYAVGVTTIGDASTPAEGSEATFITEHYWGYVSQRDGTTVEYKVEHPRWRVWRAERPTLEGDMATLYGADVAPFLARTPSSVFIAEGSEIVVNRGVPVG